MQAFSNSGAASILLAGAVVLASLAVLTMIPEASDSETMSFWEAYARGLVSVTMFDKEYERGEDTVTLPVGIRVANSADVPVVLSEEAVLMSPFPSESPATDPDATTQDAVLVPQTVPAGGSVDSFFGEEVLRGFLPRPVWWCSEEFQFTRGDVAFRVGGETLPFALRPILRDERWVNPEDNTQWDFWRYLRAHPAAVVGKDPLWTEVDAREGQRIDVRLRATNLAIYTFDDDIHDDVNVTRGVLEDRIPPGWSVADGSASVAPDEVRPAPDGGTILRWFVDLPAALESETSSPLEPTEYVTIERRYTLVSPGLAAGRHELPRAASDMDGDGAPDAHSAPLLVDARSDARPPVAHAGGPYEGLEGETIRLDASGSSDPDGDALRYRWDFTDDGAYDTAWSDDATADARYTDDFDGSARVEVTDGTHAVSATASVRVGNVAPEILGVRASARASFGVRVAGERWHDVRLDLTSGGDPLADLRAVRMPGSPSDQAVFTEVLEVDLKRDLVAILTYTPDDDPLNGQRNGDNPAWLVLAFEDGTEARFGHNFNARRTSTWTWTLRDLGPRLVAHGLVLEADLRDAGSDDLSVRWDFGDGTTATSAYYNDGMGPDPPESQGGTSPFEVTATAAHGFPEPRTYRIGIFVEDDDGGAAEATLSVRVG